MNTVGNVESADGRCLLIVWDSRTGASRQLALAAAAGARAARPGPLFEGDDIGQSHDGSARRATTLISPSQASCRHAVGAPTDGGLLVDCRHASRTRADHVRAAAGYLFIAPENLGSMTGVMKAFFDRTYYDVLDRGVAGRPYAIIVAAGSDGTGAVRQIERIVTGWRLRAIAEPMIVITDAQTPAAIAAPKRVAPDALAKAMDLGGAFATGLELGVF